MAHAPAHATPARTGGIMIGSFQPLDEPVLPLQDDKDQWRRIDRNGAAVADAAEPAAIGAVLRRGGGGRRARHPATDAMPEQIVAMYSGSDTACATARNAPIGASNCTMIENSTIGMKASSRRRILVPKTSSED